MGGPKLKTPPPYPPIEIKASAGILGGAALQKKKGSPGEGVRKLWNFKNIPQK